MDRYTTPRSHSSRNQANVRSRSSSERVVEREPRTIATRSVEGPREVDCGMGVEDARQIHRPLRNRNGRPSLEPHSFRAATDPGGCQRAPKITPLQLVTSRRSRICRRRRDHSDARPLRNLYISPLALGGQDNPQPCTPRARLDLRTRVQLARPENPSLQDSTTIVRGEYSTLVHGDKRHDECLVETLRSIERQLFRRVVARAQSDPVYVLRYAAI